MIWLRRILALGPILTVSCSVPTSPAPAADRTARNLAWASDDTLYFQSSGSSRSAVFRWRISDVPTVVPEIANTSPIAGRDGDLLVRDDATGQFRIFSPQHAQMTTLPLNPKMAQALGWDNTGRMLVRRLEDPCAWTVQAVATGSDAGTIVATEVDVSTLSPGRDALVDGRGGIRVIPLAPGGPAGTLTNGGQFQWIGPRELAVPLPGYRSPMTWLSVDLTTGKTRPLPNQPDQFYCLSPDGRLSAAVAATAIVIREVVDGRLRHSIDLKDLPPD